MSGYSVPLADTIPHLICQRKHVPLFSLPNSLVAAQKRLLSKIGTVACSTQAHLPMTCCPQAAKTTGRTPVVPSLQPWVSRSLSSAGICCGTIESDSHTSVTLQSTLNNCAVSRYVFKLGALCCRRKHDSYALTTAEPHLALNLRASCIIVSKLNFTPISHMQGCVGPEIS